MSDTRLRRDAAVNIISNVALGVLGVVSGSLVSYRLGPGARGTLGVAQVLSALTASIGTLGLGDALLHYTAKGTPPAKGAVLRGLVAVGAVAALLGGASGALVGWLWDGGMNVAQLALFGALVAASTSGFITLSGLMRGFSMFGGWNITRIAAAFAWIAALVLTSWNTLNAYALAVVYSLVLVAVTVAQYITVRSRLHRARLLQAVYPTRSQLLRFGLPSMLAAAPLILNARIDQVALGIVASQRVVGEYVAAAGYCWATVPIGQAIATLSATRVAGAKVPSQVLRRLLRVGTAAILFSSTIAWLAAPIALRVLNGDGFEGAVTISRILLVGTTFQGVTYILEESARGLGRPRVALLAELTGVAVTVALLVIATRHGAWATAVASSVGYLAGTLVACLGVARVLETSTLQMFFSPRSEPSPPYRERQPCINDLP